jgi:GH25 family lysozyme M1 (1,4-beta-N-acetylmuramidase)
MLLRVVWKKLTDVSEVVTASIISLVIMKAVRTSETSDNFYQTTRRNVPKHHILISFKDDV